MNNEFKKIVSDKVTRYVLEDGATVTTGAVATVEKPLGELQRRVDAPTPRNFVAKNAKMGGAGKMKDKSKTIPRKEKHKKPVAEGSMDELEQRRKLINYISQKKGWDVIDLELARTSELILMYKKIKEKDVSENNHPDEKEDQALIRKMVKRDALKKEGYGMNGYATAMGSRIQPGNGAGVSENDDDAGQEIGMASSELYGIAKHAKELLGLINQQGQEHGLEAWQQSKITKAADYLTSVLQNMDYDSKEEQGVAEDGAISEDGIRPKLAAALTELGFKGPFKLGQLPKWMAELQDGRFDKDTSIMIGGDDPNYDPWVAKGYDYGYAYGMETGYQTGLSAQEVFKQAKEDMGSHGVAEAEKKGLYYYVNKRKKAGTSRPASSSKAPTAQAWKDAAKTAKKEDVAEGSDEYMESLTAKLAEKIPKGADVGYYIKDFAKSTAPQFKNKAPAKRRQMAIAAWQDSKRRK